VALGVGTRLGPYEITGTLGAGGMGEVYRATDTKLGREVAIKTLPAALASDADRLARFEREAKLLAALNHAHIAAVYGLDEHAGTRYIAMELVEGETLEKRLEAGALPVEDTLQLALQIALALEAAHEKGVVHRDLKPANVMVTHGGVVKVLDFGLAKAFMGDPNEASPAHSPALSLAMTQQGLVLGTAAYMAPEQASGQGTDQRADIWAFGVVVYEMLTGHALFGGETVPHILADVLRAEPDWARLPEHLHPRIRQMLERCLEKKPRNRYAGIADARVDIEAALRDPQGVVVEQSAAGPAARPTLARRLLPWAGGLGLAVVAGAAAFMLEAPAPQPVIRASYTLPDNSTLFVPDLHEIAISADGRQMAFNTPDGLYLRQMDEFEAIRAPGLSAGTVRVDPVFSPDGASVAFLRQGAATAAAGGTPIDLVSMPTSGGAPVPLGAIGTNQKFPMRLHWDIDGSILYARPDGIWRVSGNGGEPERIIETAPDEQFSEPELLPGGERVLFAIVDPKQPDWDTARIVVESLSSHERRILRTGGSSARYVPTGHLVYAFGDVLYAAPFDVDGARLTGGPVQVVSGVSRSRGTGIAQYAFSDNGTLIYTPGSYNSSGNGPLAVLDLSARPRPFPMPAGAYAFPRVSRDGHWAAFTVTYPEGDDVAVYELGSNAAPRRLTFGGMSRYPVWSADGTRIVFQSNRDGAPSLYWQLADGSNGTATRLTTAMEGAAHTPDSVSSDGKHLTFTVTTKDGSDIWLLDMGTGESMPLIAGSGRFSQSVFSPDGRWIAYQSTETGEDEIFVQPFPLTGAKYQLPHTLDNHHPAWSADGKELFFIPGPGRFESVPITTKPRFEFGAPVVLSSMPMNAAPAVVRRYDVMPDGSGLLGFATGNTGDGSRTIDIVYNWFDEIKRKVPVH
jgi:dipeptidyl aminopeptidase/acylaminoacyl peptidase/predicted Ser/Thr protein kinase